MENCLLNQLLLPEGYRLGWAGLSHLWDHDEGRRFECIEKACGNGLQKQTITLEGERNVVFAVALLVTNVRHGGNAL